MGIQGGVSQHAPRVVSRKRVLQVRRNSERFQALIGELFGENAAQPRTKFFARDSAVGACEIDADKFKTPGLETPETLDRKR